MHDVKISELNIEIAELTKVLSDAGLENSKLKAELDETRAQLDLCLHLFGNFTFVIICCCHFSLCV